MDCTLTWARPSPSTPHFETKVFGQWALPSTTLDPGQQFTSEFRANTTQDFGNSQGRLREYRELLAMMDTIFLVFMELNSLVRMRLDSLMTSQPAWAGSVSNFSEHLI